MIRDLSPREKEQENFAAQGPADERVVPEGFYQLLILDAATILAALTCGFLYAGYLAGSVPLILLLAGTLLFAVCTVLQIFLAREFKRRAIATLLEGLGLVAAFYGQGIQAMSAAFIVLVVFLLWGEMSARRKLGNSLELQFMSAATPALGKFATALSLAALILYLPFWTPASILPSKPLFEQMFAFGAGVAHQFYSEIDFTGTISRFAESTARLKLQADPQFREIPPAEQETLIKESTGAIVQNSGKTLGMDLQGNERVGSVLYAFTLRELGRLLDRFGNWFILAWLFGAFFALRAVGSVFYWIAGLVAFGVFEILRALGVVVVRGENTTRETVGFPT